MKPIGRSLIAQTYRKLRPWLEAIEQEDAASRDALVTAGLHAFPTFLVRLVEETARAERHNLELGLVVLQIPEEVVERQPQRPLEAALRDTLRKADIPGRLSERALGVILPETGSGTVTAAERLASRLSQVAGAPISSGYARYPGDGTRPSDLIRVATERSTAPQS